MSYRAPVLPTSKVKVLDHLLMYGLSDPPRSLCEACAHVTQDAAAALGVARCTWDELDDEKRNRRVGWVRDALETPAAPTDDYSKLQAAVTRALLSQGLDGAELHIVFVPDTVATNDMLD